MKHAFLLLLLNPLFIILVSTPLLATTDNNYSTFGFAGQTYLYSTENTFPATGFAGTEFGYGLSYEIPVINTSFRSLLKFDNTRINQTQFEYLLVESIIRKNTTSLGLRVGTLQLPYGYYNELRVLPSTRIGIISPPTIIWQPNKALYDKGDGAILRFNSVYNRIILSMEYGQITRKNIEPQINYVQELIGVTSEYVTTNITHIGINYNRFDFRYDQLQPTQTFNVTQKYWDNNILSQYPYNTLLGTQHTGDFTVDYLLTYYGFRYWNKYSTLSLEKATFYYLGTGTLQTLYDSFSAYPDSIVPAKNKSLPKYSRDHYNVLLEQFWNDKYYTYIGVGRVIQQYPTDNVGEEYVGATYNYNTDIAIKMQIITANTDRWIEWYYNEDRSNISRKFKIYAIGLTYDF